MLSRTLDVARMFEQLEESCVPSYCHPNPAAASVAWLRLLVAARLWRELAPVGEVLDFGAGTGELYHCLGTDVGYHFIDQQELLAEQLLGFVPVARRETLEQLPERKYAAVFALDSLEHNADVPAILDHLLPSLREDGVFVLSGPTENRLYRLGRKIAGFEGHYHKTTVYDIETLLEGRGCKLLRCHRVPFGLPLFHVSAWTTG